MSIQEEIVINGTLAVVRAVHFAAVLGLEGAVVFRFAVVAPGLRKGGILAAPLRWTRWIVAIGWCLAVLSGAAWLVVLGSQISGQSVIDALRGGIDWILLTETQFGLAWQWRGGIAGLLVVALLLAQGSSKRARWSAGAGIVLGVALSGSLAWSGHGAATPGAIGDLHLAADIMHLVVAGLWLGGLLPFAEILLCAMHGSLPIADAAEVTRRFSTLAAASVAALLLTGIVNSWVLVGTISGLVNTLYGRLLLVKIGLFLLMFAFAAVNRIRLTPCLAYMTCRARRAANHLAIHALCELALGAAILAIVAVLGTLQPAPHLADMPMAHMRQ